MTSQGQPAQTTGKQYTKRKSGRHGSDSTASMLATARDEDQKKFLGSGSGSAEKNPAPDPAQDPDQTLIRNEEKNYIYISGR